MQFARKDIAIHDVDTMKRGATSPRAEQSSAFPGFTTMLASLSLAACALHPSLTTPAQSGARHAAVQMQQPYAGPRTSPLLDSVAVPRDMRSFTINELKQLSHELRWETINAVSKTGGHLGSSLGVVELTVALHYVFNTPDDPVIFDVSHQVYPHKILTGRRERMHTLRQNGGLSGFAKRSESEYDYFGAGHSTTSISAALGAAVAFDLQGRQRNSVAVIGDGAITGGMAYEAMNNAAYLSSRVIVVYNDNGQVSLPTGTPSAGGTVPAGSLSAYTSRLIASKPFATFRDTAKAVNKLFPVEIQQVRSTYHARCAPRSASPLVSCPTD